MCFPGICQVALLQTFEDAIEKDTSFVLPTHMQHPLAGLTVVYVIESKSRLILAIGHRA